MCLAIQSGSHWRGGAAKYCDSIWQAAGQEPDSLLMQRNAWYPSVEFNGAVMAREGTHSGFC